MTQKESTKLLVNFLKENDAYMAFRANILRQKDMVYGRRLDFFEPFRVSGNIIDRTLIWRSTKEGHEYWSDLNTKFRALYSKNLAVRIAHMQHSANN